MVGAAYSGSLRDVQQSLLWNSFGVTCFSGTIDKQRLRIRWTDPLRKLYGLTESQSLRGGPLHNNRIATVDRPRIKQACAELMIHDAPMDLSFNLQRDNESISLHAVIARLPHSNRLTGILNKVDTKREEPVSAAASHNLWQSVGRLTLLDEVTSAMAHELNQPLAAISMFAQVGERILAAPEARLEKARQLFHDVSQQALRAGDLIHAMRSLVKRQAPSKIRLSITDLIKGFVSLAEPMARTHHVDFIVPTEFPVARVLVDVAQINQVLSILFHNAVDSVNDNDVKKKVVAVAAQQADKKIIISITDSGPGVAASAAPRLFQPFFSTKENGNGLGLVSARNILETYGSRLDFVNLPERGCRFSFFLPIES